MPESARAVGERFREACLLELRAIKPGNVGYHAGGHGMTVRQFIDSADASSGALVATCNGVGERILNAVRATRERVGENTNLGIILLAAPLAEAALQTDGCASLREGVQKVLENLTIDDARNCYTAIRLANPGGMGAVDAQDIAAEPNISLRQAMLLAQDRDRIAYQYVHRYVDIF